jgi:hypothetical protein
MEVLQDFAMTVSFVTAGFTHVEPVMNGCPQIEALFVIAIR